MEGVHRDQGRVRNLKLKNKLIKTLVRALRPSSLNLGEEKRFLVLSTTGLGDTLWGTPAIRALRECFPTSYIGLVTSPIGKALLQHNGRIDEIFVAKDPLLPSLFSLYRKLKPKRITHVLNFHTSQRTVLPLSALLGAQEIVGTYGINKGLDFLLTHPLDNPPVHEIQRRLFIVAQVGAHTLDSSMELSLSPDDEKAANAFLDTLQTSSCLPLIALHPGAKDGFKQWPTSHFIELGNKLVQTLSCRIIVTGIPAEKPLVDAIVSRIEGAASATHLPLLATAALIKRMNMMIANDTGPMHLAFAQKIPAIGLFTPTNPQLCGPYFAESALAIAKKPTCTPCLHKRCQEPFCLLQIGVQDVYNSALSLFYNQPRHRHTRKTLPTKKRN
jgi:ADP-heptose:LPS heptosyltransferase